MDSDRIRHAACGMGLGILVAAVLLATGCPPASAAPKIELSASTWNLGTVGQNQSRSTTVLIRNAGDEPLVIGRVDPACKVCTEAVVSSKVVQPGQSAELRITFNSRQFRGPLSKTVTIHSNDPISPEKVLNVLAEVREADGPRLQIGTGERDLDLGILRPGESRTLSLSVRNTGEAALIIEGFQNSQAVSARIDGGNAIPPGETRVLSLTIGPLKHDGIINEYCFVKSNDPESVGSLVRFTGYVSDRLNTNGLAIRPVGDPIPIPIPGQERQYFVEYEITNQLPFPVKVDWVSSDAVAAVRLRKALLKPGESTTVALTGPAHTVGRLLRKSLRCTLEWSVVSGRSTQ